MFRIGSRITCSNGSDALPNLPSPYFVTKQQLDKMVGMCDPLSRIFYVDVMCTLDSDCFKTEQELKPVGSRKAREILQRLSKEFKALTFDIKRWRVVEGCQSGYEHIVEVTKKSQTAPFLNRKCNFPKRIHTKPYFY